MEDVPVESAEVNYLAWIRSEFGTESQFPWQLVQSYCQVKAVAAFHGKHSEGRKVLAKFEISKNGQYSHNNGILNIMRWLFDSGINANPAVVWTLTRKPSRAYGIYSISTVDSSTS
jgi:hypothetical protein